MSNKSASLGYETADLRGLESRGKRHVEEELEVRARLRIKKLIDEALNGSKKEGGKNGK